MFRGRYEHKIDSKGRTSLPSRFREVLAADEDSRLVITAGLDPCLVAYPMREWVEFEKRLADLPQFDPTVAMLRRIYVSGAVECDLDKLGRLVVPQSLRKHAALEGEVLWAGMGKHVELWALDAFMGIQQKVLSTKKTKDAMLRRLSELGL